MPQQLDDRLLSWASDLEPATVEQARRTSRLPFIYKHVALMPDAHLGMGATVGSVIPTLGAIIPAAVGVDIGCGMIAVETDWTDLDLPDDLGGWLSGIEAAVPAGVGQGHESFSVARDLHRLGTFFASVQVKEGSIARQMGTLGSGNHFIEVCLDDGGVVWVVLHSGSRGIGNKLAQYHIDKARGLMKEYFIDLEDPDLAYLVQDTAEFNDYIHDLRWAQNYAAMNRNTMMDAVLKVMGNPPELRRINCHHNYTEQENHMGKNVWVTRKGAIRAREGDFGVIPGSMGTNTFIVRGLGNPASFHSSAHGAGRRMSRTRARKELTIESLEAKMGDRTWLDTKGGALLDEHPDSYKDIQQVMRDQADLVEIETELRQVLNYKGA